MKVHYISRVISITFEFSYFGILLHQNSITLEILICPNSDKSGIPMLEFPKCQNFNTSELQYGRNSDTSDFQCVNNSKTFEFQYIRNSCMSESIIHWTSNNSDMAEILIHFKFWYVGILLCWNPDTSNGIRNSSILEILIIPLHQKFWCIGNSMSS